jgi:hypothetical protein
MQQLGVSQISNTPGFDQDYFLVGLVQDQYLRYSLEVTIKSPKQITCFEDLKFFLT